MSNGDASGFGSGAGTGAIDRIASGPSGQGGQPQAGALPGQSVRPAPSSSADQLLRLMGQSMVQGGNELATQGIRADATVLARMRASVTQVMRQMQQGQASSGAAAQAGSPTARQGGQRQPDFPVDPNSGIAMQGIAGQGDTPAPTPTQRQAA